MVQQCPQRIHRGLSQRNRGLACWTNLGDAAPLQSTAPSPELQQEPQSWGFARGIWQSPGGLNVRESTTSFVSTAKRDFATCVCWEHPAHTGRATSPAGTFQPDEPTRLAMPPRLPWGQNTCVQEQSPQVHPCSHSHRRAARVPPAWSPFAKAQDATAPQCHQSFLSSWESQKAIIVWGISSCYRNIQQDTAWQLVMSAALNQTFWTISVQRKVVGGRKKKNRIKIANVALESILPISPFPSILSSLPSLLSVPGFCINQIS